MYDRDYMMNADQIDLGIQHHFSDKIYAKQMFLPKGHVALSHKHTYSHLSVMAQGICEVTTETDGEISTTKYGPEPACIEIKAGVEHQILALEDVTWFCIHATEEKDPNKIDEVSIVKESEV